MKLVRIQLWRLPAGFFDLADDEARGRALEAVTVDAASQTDVDTAAGAAGGAAAGRAMPPMTALEEARVCLFCLLPGAPVVGLLLLGACLFFRLYECVSLIVGLAVAAALQQLPRSVQARQQPIVLLLARYFAFEVVMDREEAEAPEFAGRIATGELLRGSAGAADLWGLRQDLPPSRAPDGAPKLALACPHGVLNWGSIIFAAFSRYLLGANQVTAAATAVRVTPGLRQAVQIIWPVDAGRAEFSRRLARAEVVGLCPDGIQGIFETGGLGRQDVLCLGPKRGLARLALEHRAVIVAAYFVGTLQMHTVWQDPLGVLKFLSRKLRASLFLFSGRFGLPIPRRVPVSALGCIVSPPSAPSAAPAPGEAEKAGEGACDPTQEEVEAHHRKIYNERLASMYAVAAPVCCGLPEGSKLKIL